MLRLKTGSIRQCGKFQDQAQAYRRDKTGRSNIRPAKAGLIQKLTAELKW
jgi:hypothetical protein